MSAHREELALTDCSIPFKYIAILQNSTVKSTIWGMKKANELGIYDMSGSVAEWVSGDVNRRIAEQE